MKALERIQLESILPAEGNYIDLIVVKEIKNKISLSLEEINEFELKAIAGNRISVNETGATHKKEIEFSLIEENLIRDSLKKLNDANKLTEGMLSLYERFK